ncbi:MAG: tetratricopeptide repeat protein, partial [Planctomycetia bacterium]|nr:tetratricopeptide repeat protein [Planctomycetia bacterium]
AVEIDPLYTNAWINLGQLLESQRMYPGALDAYQRARRQEPNNNLIILLETRVRLARNELRQAARLLRKISVDPPEPALRELRARLTQELDTQTNIVESPSEQGADPLTPTQP